MEAGHSGLQVNFCNELGKAGTGNMFCAEKVTLVALYTVCGKLSERSGLSRKIREDFAANIVVCLEALNGVGLGQTLFKDVSEANGGALNRVMKTEVPQYA